MELYLHMVKQVPEKHIQLLKKFYLKLQNFYGINVNMKMQNLL